MVAGPPWRGPLQILKTIVEQIFKSGRIYNVKYSAAPFGVSTMLKTRRTMLFKWSQVSLATSFGPSLDIFVRICRGPLRRPRDIFLAFLDHPFCGLQGSPEVIFGAFLDNFLGTYVVVFTFCRLGLLRQLVCREAATHVPALRRSAPYRGL